MKYNIIYADPPWSYNDSGNFSSALKHYPTMPIEDIKSYPVKEMSDDNCILFMWGTWPLLKEAIEVIEAWGFEYKTVGFIWVKMQKKDRSSYFTGFGHYTQPNTEFCLIGKKGKIKILNHKTHQLIFSPIREHSRKPDIIRKKIIDLVGDLPRIELFARQSDLGWKTEGNQTTKFNTEQVRMELKFDDKY